MPQEVVNIIELVEVVNMKKEIIELNPHVEDMINEVMERTILKRQDIINWFVNDGYDNYFYNGDTDELIDVDFSEYKKGN